MFSVNLVGPHMAMHQAVINCEGKGKSSTVGRGQGWHKHCDPHRVGEKYSSILCFQEQEDLYEFICISI